MATKNKVKQADAGHNFPVVGIGASAGGLDAFKRFLKAIPANSGMAYVLVQHLAPTQESALPEILRRFTDIPVSEITDDIRLVPDNIYVIPANKILTTIDGKLKLSERDSIKTNLIIDVFFTSLAVVRESLAVGVILSGSGNDGTLGLKMIKDHGGITVAQDERSSAFADMPQSAIRADVADFILPPEEIPGKLIQIIRPYHSKANAKEDEDLMPKEDEAVFKQVIAVLYQRSGVDFTFYKQPTIRRRIARRIALGKKKNLTDYLKFLRSDKAEQDMLFQDMLIPVTSFFRDLKTFETLCDSVFPVLFKNKSVGDPIRIWIAGCSTGEEAYSIGMCLQEYLGKKSGGMQIQIFASDISENAIKKARTGIYSKSEISALSDARLEKYFTKIDGSYQVNKGIRDMCVFAVHNFLKDPPFAKMDLISCRNVLIYMDGFLQKKAFTTFHYALNENSILLLGKSETTNAVSELFTQINKHDKIYTRKSVPGRYMHVTTERREEALAVQNHIDSKQEVNQTDFRKNAEAILISKSPASVIVNEQMDIVYIHEDITPFLKPSPGKPTFNLMKMAREGLAFELRNALHKAKVSHAAVVKEGVSAKTNGKQFLVTIEVIPLTNTVEEHYLVLFTKTIAKEPLPVAGKKGSEGKKEALQLRNEQLEKELAQTRDDMRSIMEEHDAANEELQSSNEELQSSNEEMQSLNEELETSKEELQSTNEELLIINQELLDKQEQLSASRQYAESIVSTVRDPMIVLDKNLRIKSANISFYKKFKVSEIEIEGKTFYEIQSRQWDDPELRKLLEEVLPAKRSLENYEITLTVLNSLRTLLINARQLLNEKNEELLILLSIEDITERIKHTSELQKSKSELLTAVEGLRHTNKQLDQFAHIASHDLQEPLRSISIYSGLLQKTAKDRLQPNESAYLKSIASASSRMTRLVKELLNFASVINAKELFKPIDLNAILKNVLTDFELLIEEKQANIKADNLPSIEAISLHMNQLFYNLIGNALKFSKEDVPPVITITSRTFSESSTRYCELIFKDNGIGFNQKFSEQIFTIFQRLNKRDQYTGTGIGLSLCKKIAELHGGKIFARSKENEGTEIHLILPLKQASNAI